MNSLLFQVAAFAQFLIVAYLVYAYYKDRSFIFIVSVIINSWLVYELLYNPNQLRYHIRVGKSPTGDGTPPILTDANLIAGPIKEKSFEDPIPVGKLRLEGDDSVVCLNKMKTPMIPSKSRLQHSKLYGKIIESKTCPAILEPTFIGGVLVDPLMNSFSQYTHIS